MKEFDLEPGEHVVRESRKHWFLFALELLPYVFLLAVPYALPHVFALNPAFAPYVFLLDLQNPLVRAALGVYLLIVWTGAWNAFTRYFLNLWVLTNQRIVDIKQRGYFRREVSSLLIERVQDVTTDVNGVFPSLLGFGNIKVQTAGEDIEFVMHGIPRPEQMRDLVLKYVADDDNHSDKTGL